ncbi:hypothetical protein Tco_0496158 [Tanacetum coccineum]
MHTLQVLSGIAIGFMTLGSERAGLYLWLYEGYGGFCGVGALGYGVWAVVGGVLMGVRVVVGGSGGCRAAGGSGCGAVVVGGCRWDGCLVWVVRVLGVSLGGGLRVGLLSGGLGGGSARWWVDGLSVGGGWAVLGWGAANRGVGSGWYAAVSWVVERWGGVVWEAVLCRVLGGGVAVVLGGGVGGGRRVVVEGVLVVMLGYVWGVQGRGGGVGLGGGAGRGGGGGFVGVAAYVGSHGMLSIECDLSFSGGGDDEGSAATNSVMHASADGNRGVCLMGSGHHVGYSKRVGRRLAGCQKDPPKGVLYPLPDWSQQCSLVIGL